MQIMKMAKTVLKWKLKNLETASERKILRKERRRFLKSGRLNFRGNNFIGNNSIKIGIFPNYKLTLKQPNLQSFFMPESFLKGRGAQKNVHNRFFENSHEVLDEYLNFCEVEGEEADKNKTKIGRAHV